MKDRIIIGKIQDYVRRTKRIYELIKDLDEQEILSLDDSFALTQFLINIHSLFSNITSDEIARKQVDLGIRSLNTCRNISAHDYDALDWVRVKQLCKKLLSESTEKLLQECYDIAKKDESNQKDYSAPNS
ncbi:MAG: hypothetical protein FWB96_12450 [Defluviitaleaceae bacterium]|nr:hypothetical protein [Defluviitaleaceae bacterium]MCL2264058.1 hypothetical protein [Defluviitaleaceae bacterium]